MEKEAFKSNMSIEKFEDIQSWQRAKHLTVRVYELFGASKDFGFRDQIQRASASVMNNIAEGFERGTNNEFKHFLYMAKGSCGEVRSMLRVAVDLGYITKKEYKDLNTESTEISKLLSGLIKTL